jgi:hypothetical protein
MSNRTIIILLVAIVFLALSIGVGRAITAREIAKIPPAQREQMSDFDWIGFEESLPVSVPFAGVALLAGAAGLISAARDYRLTTARRS